MSMSQKRKQKACPAHGTCFTPKDGERMESGWRAAPRRGGEKRVDHSQLQLGLGSQMGSAKQAHSTHTYIHREREKERERKRKKRDRERVREREKKRAAALWPTLVKT